VKSKILLVEDNEQLSETNRLYLELAGYDVRTAYCLSEAHSALSESDPDVILLDVMLPDGDGVDFCREIYDETDAKIIFLTAKASEEDQIKGFEAGGSVFLTKPYSLKVMVSCIESALRKRKAKKDKFPKILKIGNLRLNMQSALASWNDTDLLLSKKEFSVLLLLSEHYSKPVSPEFMYETIWKAPLGNDKNSLWRHISSLRRKLFAVCGEKAEITYSRASGYVLTVFEK
jgi:DNA-binding response OmpR family regulator